jgi:nucleoside 2-deoxyribosyltransferase
MKVYLSGPITGLVYEHTMEWRRWATNRLYLESPKFRIVNPMRGKDYLTGVGPLSPQCDQHPKHGAREVMTRDHFDTINADVVLANFLGAQRVSIGTVMEVAWAWDRRIPVVAVMEPDNIHDHAMVIEAIGFRFSTLDDAIQCVIELARPYL